MDRRNAGVPLWRWHLFGEAGLATLLVPLAFLDFNSTCSSGGDWITLPCHGWLILGGGMLLEAEGILATTFFAVARFVQRDQTFGRPRVIATLVLPHVAAVLTLHLTSNLVSLFVGMIQLAI